MSKGGCYCSAVLVCQAIASIGILISSVALILVSLYVTIPYTQTNHFHTSPSTCSVNGSVRLGDAECDCSHKGDLWCKSTYPCVQVTVFYQSEAKSNRAIALLYHQPEKYTQLKKDKCSTFTCDKDRRVNDRAVNKFVNQYGQQYKRFNCYIGDGSSPDEALLFVIEKWRHLLGMLVPSFLLVIFGFVLVYYRLCYRRSSRGNY